VTVFFFFLGIEPVFLTNLVTFFPRHSFCFFSRIFFLLFAGSLHYWALWWCHFSFSPPPFFYLLFAARGQVSLSVLVPFFTCELSSGFWPSSRNLLVFGEVLLRSRLPFSSTPRGAGQQTRVCDAGRCLNPFSFVFLLEVFPGNLNLVSPSFSQLDKRASRFSWTPSAFKSFCHQPFPEFSCFFVRQCRFFVFFSG